MQRITQPFEVRNVGTREITIQVGWEEVPLLPGGTLLAHRVTVPYSVCVVRRAGGQIDLVAVGDIYEDDDAAEEDPPSSSATNATEEATWQPTHRASSSRWSAKANAATMLAKRPVPLWTLIAVLAVAAFAALISTPRWAGFLGGPATRGAGMLSLGDNASVPPASGRYAIVRAGDQSAWRLDTATGGVSLCGRGSTPLTNEGGQTELDEQGKATMRTYRLCVAVEEQALPGR